MADLFKMVIPPPIKEVKGYYGISCDICKKEFDVGSMDYQEIISIKHPCGFNSIFGDENTVRCDICQNCLKEKLGEYLIIE